MLSQRARSRLLRAGASILGLAGSLACFAAPPPPAAEHPYAAPPRQVQQATAARAGCDAVKRADRTWVGFAEGMTLDDMVPAGNAAEDVVRALDAAVCSLGRGEPVPELATHRARLRTLAANGGAVEVTKVLWRDVALLRAEVELRSVPPSDGWRASVVRSGEAWKIAAFTTQRD